MTPPAAWWPQARPRPIRWATTAGPLAQPPIGWLLHVADTNGSLWGMFDATEPPNRRFAHLWIAKDGTVEQYAPLTHKAWHAADGNTHYYGVETEGRPWEPLTIAQLRTLADWHVWSRFPDRIANRPGDPGIGTHFMGGAAWGAHSCPDPVGREGQGPRSRQRQDILTTARALRAQPDPSTAPTTTIPTQPTTAPAGDDMPLNNDDLNQIARVVWGSRFGNSLTTGEMLQRAATGTVNVTPEAIAAMSRAIADQVITQGGAALAKATADELHARLAG